jgi:hypothetical protein
MGFNPLTKLCRRRGGQRATKLLRSGCAPGHCTMSHLGQRVFTEPKKTLAVEKPRKCCGFMKRRQRCGHYGSRAHAGGKNDAHRITLAIPHNTAQTAYTLPHRGHSTSRLAADQYVLGSDGSNRSAICVCAFVSKVMPSIMACTACAVVVDGLRRPKFPRGSKYRWEAL